MSFQVNILISSVKKKNLLLLIKIEESYDFAHQ